MSRSPTSKVIWLRRGWAWARLDLAQLVADHGPQLALVGEDGLELGDGRAQLGQLLLEVGPAQAGEPAQRHVEDVLGLLLGELERLGHEAPRGPPGVSSLARMVAMISSIRSSALMSPSTMWARPAGLLEAELRPAPDDLLLVVDVGDQGVAQAQGAGHAVDEGHGVDREVRLQRGALVEVVEDDQARGVPLEPQDQAQLALGRLVVELGDALELPAVDQVLDLQDELVGAHLVRAAR